MTDAQTNAPDLADIVRRVKRHDPTGMEDLYSLLNKGIRYQICRQLGPRDLNDTVHDCFLAVVQALQSSELRDPERLMCFAETVSRRQIVKQIKKNILDRQTHCAINEEICAARHTINPESEISSREQADLIRKTLTALPQARREVLTRFYINEEPADTIQREMHLNDTQFRLLKSRAKAQFGKWVRRTLKLRELPNVRSPSQSPAP